MAKFWHTWADLYDNLVYVQLWFQTYSNMFHFCCSCLFGRWLSPSTRPPQKKMTSLRRNVGDPQSQGGASSRYPGESRWLGTPHLQKGARTETQTSILSILSHLLCRGSSCIFIRSQMEAMDQLVVCSIWQGCGCVWFRTAVFGICK